MLKEKKCIFVINQADALVLNKIRTNLGFGKVSPYNQKGRVFARYVVQGEMHVYKLIQIFNGNIHLQKVFNRFEKWLNHYNTYAQNAVLLKPRQNVQNITLEGAWLAGFYDAEGGFHASIGSSVAKNGKKVLRLRVNAYVDQQYEYEVMERIKTLFSISSVTIRNAQKQNFRVEASTKKTLANLLKYFDTQALKGKKHIVYAMWKKVARRFVEEKHLGQIESLANNVKQIQEQNKKFKVERNAFCFITMVDEVLL